MILSEQYNFKQNKRLAYEMTTHKRCNNIYIYGKTLKLEKRNNILFTLHCAPVPMEATVEKCVAMFQLLPSYT